MKHYSQAAVERAMRLRRTVQPPHGAALPGKFQDWFALNATAAEHPAPCCS